MEFQDYVTRLENTNEGRRPKIGEEEIARGEQRVQPEAATRTPVPATPTDNQEKQSSNMVGSAFGLLDHVRLGTNSSMLLALRKRDSKGHIKVRATCGRMAQTRQVERVVLEDWKILRRRKDRK